MPEIYVFARKIKGYSPIIAVHFFVRLKFTSDKEVRAFNKQAADEMGKYTTVFKECRNVTVGTETWKVMDLGANKDDNGKLGTYLKDSDDEDIDYEYRHIKLHPDLNSVEMCLLNAWISYDKIYSGEHLKDKTPIPSVYQIPYEDLGPNCITFAMSLLRAVGYGTSYLYPLFEQLFSTADVGGERLLIHPTFFNDLTDINVSIDGSKTDKFAESVSGVICKNANFRANNSSTIKVQGQVIAYVPPSLICTGDVNISVENRSTFETKVIVCKGNLNLDAAYYSTINIALDANCSGNTNATAKHSSTINITRNLNCKNVNIHEDDKCTVTIGGTLDCNGNQADFFVGDASTATVGTHCAGHAQLHAFGASTINIRNGRNIVDIGGKVESSSTIVTNGFHGSGRIVEESCGTWKR